MRIYNKNLDQNIPAEAVYVGRGSNWGNPFVIGIDGDREEVIAKYSEWALDNWTSIDGWLAPLRGKDLVCFCAPKACHAEILIELCGK